MVAPDEIAKAAAFLVSAEAAAITGRARQRLFAHIRAVLVLQQLDAVAERADGADQIVTEAGAEQGREIEIFHGRGVSNYQTGAVKLR